MDKAIMKEKKTMDKGMNHLLKMDKKMEKAKKSSKKK